MEEAFEKELENAVLRNQAFIIRGSTGSGKTWFVEKLAELLGEGVVLVPQYPLFKPQLRVDMFINMLPLHGPARAKLKQDLDKMGVPIDKRIGGKLMGMLEVSGLSGGQRKKLLLALAVQLALARNAKAMVLDEPFAGIDAASMPLVLEVLQEVNVFKDVKIFLVTHDHFQLIEDAFPGTPLLKIDARQLQVSGGSAGTCDTLSSSQLVAKTILEQPSVRKPPSPPLVDTYVVKRYFVEGEQFLPTFTTIVFGCLSGMATAAYNGNGNGIVAFSSIYAFLKIFMLEYIHFGSILNYCFKRGQHLEDFNLMLTRKRDAILETVIIAAIQSVTLAFLLNGILVGIGARFWWVNSNVLFIDAFYALLTQVAYTLLPVIQPNPLITMGSIFPYVALWGFFAGYLLPRDMALKNARWLTLLSPTYHFACANAKASNGQIKLPGSNCKKIGIHLAFISPLLLFVIVCLVYIRIKKALRTKSNNFKMANLEVSKHDGQIEIADSRVLPHDDEERKGAEAA
mmetsp:Transcript_7270/g.22169  ORF Transcript_7270/g.22169 Transcript_7270/m.22169 type:complete len:513 (+) Transcript_7270:113-1651(+)|eukprot:CAMPEP_0197394280 /NCGR_PEP_ID=MMETSP1165-20131217/4792_1 /TAXON_ID=284809 /ORGANISM="Chrysocystis fragilis, Strain CCMP3189" /LENGTH=512 /DNA_ID=CAMNT_0042919967 /DNA_START=81 /DNA_END=1619 /DNA_ORIENTATION=+